MMENDKNNGVDEREFAVKHMLTVEKLIEHLKKFNPKALVCYLEINSNAWCSQSPKNLDYLVRTVSDEKDEIRRNEEQRPRFYRSKEEMEEGIKTLFRYVKDDDVLIRF